MQEKKCFEWTKIEDSNKLEELVKELKKWELIYDGNSIKIPKLCRKIKTKDIVSAIEYINKLSKIAEERGHHPDIHLTSYNNLKIIIYTYSLKGLTENDFNLAKAINEIEN